MVRIKDPVWAEWYKSDFCIAITDISEKTTPKEQWLILAHCMGFNSQSPTLLTWDP